MEQAHDFVSLLLGPSTPYVQRNRPNCYHVRTGSQGVYTPVGGNERVESISANLLVVATSQNLVYHTRQSATETPNIPRHIL